MRRTNLLEQVIRGLLAQVESDDPATQAKLRDEIDANADMLHAAQSYQSLQDYLLYCMQNNPGHEQCVAIQCGFQLGLRFAKAGIQ